MTAAAHVVVVCVNPDNVASRCLKAEAVEHQTFVCQTDMSYGALLKSLWESGESFVLVEDDVAPVPGIVEDLAACDEPWCGCDYPLGFGRMRGEHPGLGCVKFHSELIAACPNAWRQWGNTPWRQLDAQVARAIRPGLKQLLDATDEEGRETGAMDWYHNHGPVAHAQHYRGATP